MKLPRIFKEELNALVSTDYFSYTEGMNSFITCCSKYILRLFLYTINRKLCPISAKYFLKKLCYL